MEEEAPDLGRPIKLKADGTPDGRGHSEGSKATRLRSGHKRPGPGRPKGSRDERSEVEEIKNMTVKAVVNGRERRVGTRMFNMLRMREKAGKGDIRAIEWLDRKFAQYEPPVVELHLTAQRLEEDQAILADARARGVLGPGLPPPADPEEGAA